MTRVDLPKKNLSKERSNNERMGQQNSYLYEFIGEVKFTIESLGGKIFKLGQKMCQNLEIAQKVCANFEVKILCKLPIIHQFLVSLILIEWWKK